MELELEEVQADVVCLQEVQADHYEQHMRPALDRLGYDSIYKAKSREVTGQYGKVSRVHRLHLYYESGSCVII